MPTKPMNQTLKEIVVAKLRFGLQQYMSPVLLEDLNVDITNDFILDRLIIGVRGWLYSRKILHETETQIVETVRYPTNWFEALKERWLPNRLLRKFPVKYIVKNVVVTYNHTHLHTCPHIKTKSQGSHIGFLIAASCPTERTDFKNPEPNNRPWNHKILDAIMEFQKQGRTPTLILVTPDVWMKLIQELDEIQSIESMIALYNDKPRRTRLFGYPIEMSESVKDFQVLGE